MSTIVVFSDKTWYGPSNRGNFSVIIDGAIVGTLVPNGQVTCDVTEGQHEVRIRQLWFASSNEHFEISAGQTMYLRSEFANTGIKKLMVSLFNPNRLFKLQEIDRIERPIVTMVDPRPYQRLTMVCAAVVIGGVVIARLFTGSHWAGLLGILAIVFGIVGSLLLSLRLRRKVRPNSFRQK
jgi:hypothetical protein